MKHLKWLNENCSSLKGKTVALTGSTGGIGVHLVKYLSFLDARLILIDRNRERASDLRNKFPETDITLITADMSDFSSVISAAEKLKELKPDYLILNAGAYSIPRKICDTGFDNVFQINFVSQYYLAKELLPEISKLGGGIVAVGSIAHGYSKIDKSNLDFHNIKAASKAYGNAKRWLQLCLYSLFEDEKGARLAVTHPGITFTGITNHYPKLIFALIKHPMKVIFMKPEKAALCVLKGLFCECKTCEWIGPRFFGIWGKPKKSRLASFDIDEYEYCKQKAEEIFNKMGY